MVAEGRRQNRWTAVELADRLGTTTPTLRRIENGDPGVAIGLFLDAAVLCGVQLFSTTDSQMGQVAREAQLRRALLPQRVRTSPVSLDDAF